QYGASAAELRERLADAPHEIAMPGGMADPDRASVKRLLDRSCEALSGTDGLAVLAAFGAFVSAAATIDLLALYLGYDRRRVQDALNVLVDVSLAKRVV